MRWLVRKIYPKETFTDRRAAVLADLALLAAALVAAIALAAYLV